MFLYRTPEASRGDTLVHESNTEGRGRKYNTVRRVMVLKPPGMERSVKRCPATHHRCLNMAVAFGHGLCIYFKMSLEASPRCVPGSGKSHLAQSIGQAAIQQGYRVLYRETHTLLEELAEASIDGTRRQHIECLVTVPLLIIDDLGMRKLSLTAAEELLEIIMRRYERTSTIITSNRPVEDWGKLLGDSAAVTAMLDRLLHHGHVLKCGPRSWRTKTGLQPQQAAG